MPEPTLPVPTPEQTALGCRLYNQLGLCASSYRDWFAEGQPYEWVRALDAIQKTLNLCKRQASAAAREDKAVPPGTLPLFGDEGDA